MENLLRFGERKNKFGVTQMMCCTDGEYVKFSDIKELRSSTAHNSDYAAVLRVYEEFCKQPSVIDDVWGNFWKWVRLNAEKDPHYT